jgi:hypothetical protein
MQVCYKLSTILSFKHAINFVVFCLQIGTLFWPSFHIFLFYKFFININLTCFIFRKKIICIWLFQFLQEYYNIQHKMENSKQVDVLPK